MALAPPSNVHEVHVISEEQKARIRDFLQGAVYSWCKNRPNEWFSMRDLMGGENFYWQGTPLFVLYQVFEKIVKAEGTDNAVERAGQASGRLLKRVIADDSRIFETKHEALIRKYKWLPGAADNRDATPTPVSV